MSDKSYFTDEIFIKLERKVKKNKFFLISLLAIFLIYVSFNYINNEINTKKTIKANEIYLSLIKNKDSEKLEELKKLNKNLYFSLLLNENYSNELANFAVSNEDILLTNIYNARFDKSNLFLKDLSSIQTAYQLIKDNKIDEASKLLNNIKSNSPLYKIASNLKHYQGQ